MRQSPPATILSLRMERYIIPVLMGHRPGHFRDIIPVFYGSGMRQSPAY